MQMNAPRIMPNPQKMPMHPGQIYMHPSMQMNPQGQMGGSKPMPNMPRMNMNGNSNYMPQNSMMMNQPIYFNNMMPYGMPIRN